MPCYLLLTEVRRSLLCMGIKEMHCLRLDAWDTLPVSGKRGITRLLYHMAVCMVFFADHLLLYFYHNSWSRDTDGIRHELVQEIFPSNLCSDSSIPPNFMQHFTVTQECTCKTIISGNSKET